jgi:ACS family hexuronate transporter-like MFS transporter
MHPSIAKQIRKPSHSHMRWVICALLFWVTMANYIDRSVFGNLAPEMTNYLHLANRVKPAEVEQYWEKHSSELAPMLTGYPHAGSDIRDCAQCQVVVRQQVAKKNWEQTYWSIQMLFIAVYAISSLLMGRMMDLFGLRWGFPFACALWSLGSLAQSIAPEIGNLFGNPVIGFYLCTAVLSMGQGANFPTVTKTTAEWFPKRERALATGFFISGSNLAALVVPLGLAALIAALSRFSIGGRVIGWRGAFIPGVLIDVLLIAVWLMVYRKPADHPRVSQVELALINSDGVVEPMVKLPWRKLIPHRQTWAFVLAKFLTDGYWWFYLFGAADFFHRKFGLSLNDRKYMIMLIYILAMAGSIGGGWLVGRFMRSGWSLNKARKITLLICALLVVPVFFASITSSKWVAAMLIMLAASGHQAWNANVSCLVGDMFPRRVIGSVSGFAGMISSVGGVALLFLTGKVVSLTGSYLLIFIMASVAYLLALVVVQLLVPKLEPANIEFDHHLGTQPMEMAPESFPAS